MKRTLALFLAIVLLASTVSMAFAEGTYTKATGNFSYRNGISFGMTSAEVAAVEAKNGLNGNGEDYDKVQKVGQSADKEYFFDELGYFYFVGDGNGNITSMSIDIDSYADQLNDGIYSSIKYQYDDNGGLSVITHTFPYFTVSTNLYNALVADMTAEFGSPDYGTKLNSQSPVSIMTQTSETSYTISDTYKNNLFVVFSTLGIGNFKIIEQNTWCIQYENGGVMIDAFCVRMGADTDQYQFYFPILTYHAVSQDFMDTHFKTAKNTLSVPTAAPTSKTTEIDKTNTTNNIVFINENFSIRSGITCQSTAADIERIEKANKSRAGASCSEWMANSRYEYTVSLAGHTVELYYWVDANNEVEQFQYLLNTSAAISDIQSSLVKKYGQPNYKHGDIPTLSTKIFTLTSGLSILEPSVTLHNGWILQYNDCWVLVEFCKIYIPQLGTMGALNYYVLSPEEAQYHFVLQNIYEDSVQQSINNDL